MDFDFTKFTQVAERTYNGGPYSFEDVLLVFRYYFQRYEEFTGHAHPPIRVEQIRRIIETMPYISGTSRPLRDAEISAEDYFPLIEAHFKTQYRNCDFNINHFFSGRIRELRFFEEFY